MRALLCCALPAVLCLSSASSPFFGSASAAEIDWTKYVEFRDAEDPAVVMRTAVKPWTDDEKTYVLELLRTFPEKGEGLLQRTAAMGPMRFYRVADSSKVNVAGRSVENLWAQAQHLSHGVYFHDLFFKREQFKSPLFLRWTLFHEFVHLADVGPTSLSESSAWAKLVDGRIRQAKANIVGLDPAREEEAIRLAVGRAGVPSRYAAMNRREALAEYATTYFMAEPPMSAENFTLPDDVRDYLIAKLFQTPFEPDRSFPLVYDGLNLLQRAAKPAEAMAKADAAVELNPKNSRAYYLRGLIHHNQEKYPEAIDDFQKALSLYETDGPERTVFHRYLGNSFVRLKDDVRALEHLRLAAVGRDPYDLTELAAALVRAKEFDEAIGVHDRLVGLTTAGKNQAHLAALFNRAAVKLDKPDAAAAQADLDAVVAIDPQDSALYAGRAAFWTNRGNHDAAERDFAKAIELVSPDKATALYKARGQARQGRRAHREAVDDYTVVLNASKTDVTTLLARGKSRLAIGETDGAVADADAILKIFPRPVPDAVQLRIDARVAAGQREKCLEEIDALITKYPTNDAWKALRTDVVKRFDEAAKAKPAPTSNSSAAPTTAEPEPSSAAQGPAPEMILQTGHTAGTDAIAFTPNGRYVVVGSNEGSASIWDIGTGQKLREYRGRGGVYGLAVSRDGEILATCGYWSDGETRLWRTATGELLHKRADPDFRYVSDLAFSPDGKWLAAGGSGSDGRHLRLFNVADGTLLRGFSSTASINAVAVSADGRMLASGDDDDTVIVWDAVSGAKLHTFAGHSDDVIDVAFSPDGERVVVVTRADTSTKKVGELAVWELAGERKIASTGDARRQYASAVFTADGKSIVTGGRNIDADQGEIRRWSAELELQQSVLQPDTYEAKALALHPDGKRLFTAYYLPIELDATSFAETRRFGTKLDFHESAAFSDRGTAFFSLVSDRVLTWEPPRGVPRIVAQAATKHSFRWLAPASDGKSLLTWEQENGSEKELGRLNVRRLTRIDLATGELRRGEPYGKTYLQHAALSLNGRFVVTGESGEWDVNSPVCIFDAHSGALLRTLNGHKRYVNSVAVTADGSRILSSDDTYPKGTAIFWDAVAGRELQRFDEDTNVYSSGLSPDGTQAVLGFYGAALLWDPVKGTKGRRLSGHTHAVEKIRFSRDGSRFVTVGSSADEKVLLWKTDGEEPLAALTGYSNSIYGISFSDGDRFLVTTSGDRTIRIWDVANGRESARLMTWEQGKDWLVTTPDGRFDCSPGAEKYLLFRKGTGLDVVGVDAIDPKWRTAGLLGKALETQPQHPVAAAATTNTKTATVNAPASTSTAATPDKKDFDEQFSATFKTLLTRAGSSAVTSAAVIFGGPLHDDDLTQLVKLRESFNVVAISAGPFEGPRLGTVPDWAEKYRELLERAKTEARSSCEIVDDLRSCLARTDCDAVILIGFLDKQKAALDLVPKTSDAVTMLRRVATMALQAGKHVYVQASKFDGVWWEPHLQGINGPLGEENPALIEKQVFRQTYLSDGRSEGFADFLSAIRQNEPAVRSFARLAVTGNASTSSKTTSTPSSTVTAPAVETTPADQCVLEVQTPAGATVTLDGKNYGAQRRFEWGSLAAGQSYVSQLRVRFADGGEAQRTVIVQGGRKIDLPVRGPSRIVFSHDTFEKNFATQIFACTPDGRNTVRISDRDQFNNYPKISPDGIAVAYKSDNDIYLVELDGSNHRQWITDLAFISLSDAAWSPDGRLLAFTAVAANDKDHRGLYLGDLATKSARRIGEGYYPQFSPDGRRIVFSDKQNQGEIRIVGIDGGSSIRLVNGTGAVWSPDGANIAFLRIPIDPTTGKKDYERRELRLIDPDGNNERLIVDGVISFDWSPDGAQFAYTTYKGGDLSVIHLETGRQRTVVAGTSTKTTIEMCASPRWSPDGKEIAFVRGRFDDDPNFGIEEFPNDTKLQAVDVASGRVRTVVHYQGETMQIDWR